MSGCAKTAHNMLPILAEWSGCSRSGKDLSLALLVNSLFWSAYYALVSKGKWCGQEEGV